jgi:hypothetical protein
MLGVTHYDGVGAPAFVFDMMEPERAEGGPGGVAFLKSEALHPADFTVREDALYISKFAPHGYGQPADSTPLEKMGNVRLIRAGEQYL